MKKYYYLVFLLAFSMQASAQMQIDGETLYGNEWIDYAKDHIKVTVAADGIYKVSYEELLAQGINPGVYGSALRMHHLGKQVPIHTSTDQPFGNGDYILFYGERNKGEIDRHLYDDWSTQQLNPKYSLFTDESAYYLTWGHQAQTSKRFNLSENDLSGTLPVKENYYMHVEEKVFKAFAYTPSAPAEASAHFSSFIQSEGFGTNLQRNHNQTFALNNIIDSGPAAKLEFRTGSTGTTHIIDVEFNGKLLERDNYGGNKIRQYSYDIPVEDLELSSTLSLKGLGTFDNILVGYASVTYPRRLNAYDADEFHFSLEGGSFNKYFEIQSFDGSPENYLFDIGNEKVYIPTIEDGKAKIFIPQAGAEDSKLILIEPSKFKTAVGVESVSFTQVETLNPQYLILTSSELNNSDTGTNPVEEYAAFRESELGGGYKVGIVNIENVIEQFGYGIQDHSYAVRNFSNYVKNKWPNFEMVFIIGKSLTYTRRNANLAIPSYVPTYGNPGSDNLLFAEPGVTYPYVGVGRLSALDKDDIVNYRRKAMAHAMLRDLETGSLEDRLWLKNVIHLSGGDFALQQLIAQHLANMEDTLATNLFAGVTRTYAKTSTDPVQTSLSLDIIDRINEGSTILTFFGHSSANTFDFSIEDPNKWQNEGKNMIILSMGCHSGDIHEWSGTDGVSLSERMVLAEDKGAIAFVASSGNAFPSALSLFGYEWYSEIGNEFYGEPIGNSIQHVLEEQYSLSNTKLRTLHEQNTLHGDPAISLPAASGVDYVVDFNSVSTNDEIGTQDDKIELTFDIVNLGRGQVGRLNNYVIHNYGDSKSDTIYFDSNAPFNRETITLELNNPGAEAIGKNTINIVLDHDSKVDELPLPIAETNNDMQVAFGNEGFCFFVFDNSAFPIYPSDFAIVNNPDISLLASATNAFADKEYYILEIDTTELYNSPLLETTEILSSPGLISWNPNLEFQENTVYYWRIIPKDMTSSIWNQSSFIYLPNSSVGWNQSHFYQWVKDDYTTYEMDSTTRDFEFADNLIEFSVRNGTFPAYTPTVVAENEDRVYLSSLADGEIASGLTFAIFSDETGEAWLNYASPDGGLYESDLYTSWAQDWPVFPYKTQTKEDRESIIKLLLDVVPDGYYVAAWTIQRSDSGALGDYNASEWASDSSTGRDLMTIFENEGATQVRELANETKPWIFVYRKGDHDHDPQEVLASDVSEQISVNSAITVKWHEGDVQSTLIGPAFKWNKLLWNIDEIDLAEDSYKLDIYGVTEAGDEVLLFEDVDEFDFDLSSVNTDEYPQLRLSFFSTDEESRSSAQMEYWRVVYEEKPEAVLDTDTKFVFNNDTLSLGQTLRLNTIATNITDTDMDSLLVHYTIVDDQNNEINRAETLAPLKAKQTIDIDFEFDTGGLTGLHQFIVEINPDEAQPEQFDFNNIGIKDFRIFGDNVNPLLDVTFDGMHIMDGDIVSSQPFVCVSVKDESSFLFLDDLTSFDLALQKLPDAQSFPIDLTDPDIIFTPGDSTNNNVAKLQLPLDLESGEYILFVQARDASGNLSGDHAYEVEFQVVKETTVSNVLNYPNPFSTSTEFVFTLTGQRVPDVFTIQIMTLSGKVVREITKEQLGNLRIGINRSSYKWDGTDEFGSKLANGVYLYRVHTDYSGEEYEQFNIEGVDDFFKKGFGKLVILR